ncbi:hypothetical protein E2C01_048559 [Portunus trituberculatus]|uniref:Uncharacterized protein n=1 Tax=Portunus trituberculatus TaxID=210409 RepID=A0A5B7GBA2_PORTR|nr:hypothetical protein [Portunus trituberculatus]
MFKFYRRELALRMQLTDAGRPATNAQPRPASRIPPKKAARRRRSAKYTSTDSPYRSRQTEKAPAMSRRGTTVWSSVIPSRVHTSSSFSNHSSTGCDTPSNSGGCVQSQAWMAHFTCWIDILVMFSIEVKTFHSTTVS